MISFGYGLWISSLRWTFIRAKHVHVYSIRVACGPFPAALFSCSVRSIRSDGRTHSTHVWCAECRHMCVEDGNSNFIRWSSITIPSKQIHIADCVRPAVEHDYNTYNPTSIQLNFIYNIFPFVSNSFAQSAPDWTARYSTTADKSEFLIIMLTLRLHCDSTVDAVRTQRNLQYIRVRKGVDAFSVIYSMHKWVSERKSKIEFPMWKILNNWIHRTLILWRIQYCFFS